MKTLKVILTAIVLMCTAPVFASILITDSSARTAGTPVDEQRSEKFAVLRSINRSDLNRTEKRSLRKEQKKINKELRAVSGGVYISVGVLLVVIILLIILL